MHELMVDRRSRGEADIPGQQKTIKDISRLWQYRNGMNPVDEIYVPPVRPTAP